MDLLKEGWGLARKGGAARLCGWVPRATRSLLPRAQECSEVTRLPNSGESARLYFNCGAATRCGVGLRVAAATGRARATVMRSDAASGFEVKAHGASSSVASAQLMDVPNQRMHRTRHHGECSIVVR